MKSTLRQIKIGYLLRIMGNDGNEITIERVKLGNQLGWHLHHGKKRIISKSISRISNYIVTHRQTHKRYGEIMDLGEF